MAVAIVFRCRKPSDNRGGSDNNWTNKLSHLDTPSLSRCNPFLSSPKNKAYKLTPWTTKHPTSVCPSLPVDHTEVHACMAKPWSAKRPTRVSPKPGKPSKANHTKSNLHVWATKAPQCHTCMSNLAMGHL